MLDLHILSFVGRDTLLVPNGPIHQHTMKQYKNQSHDEHLLFVLRKKIQLQEHQVPPDSVMDYDAILAIASIVEVNAKILTLRINPRSFDVPVHGLGRLRPDRVSVILAQIPKQTWRGPGATITKTTYELIGTALNNVCTSPICANVRSKNSSRFCELCDAEHQREMKAKLDEEAKMLADIFPIRRQMANSIFEMDSDLENREHCIEWIMKPFDVRDDEEYEERHGHDHEYLEPEESEVKWGFHEIEDPLKLELESDQQESQGDRDTKELDDD